MNVLKLTNEETNQLLALIEGACATGVIQTDDRLNNTVYDQLQDKILNAQNFGSSEANQ